MIVQMGRRSLVSLSLIVAVAHVPLAGQSTQTSRDAPIFVEDFEGGLERWTFPFGSSHRLVETGTEQNAALALRVQSLPVYALMDGSDAWPNVRVEGKVLFPDTADSYLGFIYRYRDDGRRTDFGSLYIKGNDSYVQANPHHDTNVGRTLYPEMRVALTGDAAIRIGAWQRFALEVVGSRAHLYVGPSGRPVMTLPFGGEWSGAFGFKPRNPGAEVWIDDIRVEAIDDFSHEGPPVPDPRYGMADWIRDWQVLGPLTAHAPEIEAGAFRRSAVVRDDGRSVAWRPLEADARGAIFSGRVTEFRGGRRVAYFRAGIEAETAGRATLELASADDLAIWVNGEFIGFAGRQGAAWWDAATGSAHAPLRVTVDVRAGTNDLLVRATGGVYATGGFFARVAR